MGKAFITTFKYDCELEFHGSDGTTSSILKQCVKYIIIDHDYSDSIMPVMYMRVNLRPSIYNKMVPDQGKGKLYITLFRTRNKGSTSSTQKAILQDEFDYYMTDDPDTFRRLDEDTNSQTSYKSCLIGILKLDLQKQNQRTFEGIYKNSNAMSLIQDATSKMKMVIQPFDNNTSFTNFVCPTITTIAQFIAYINTKASLYKGSYMYYMDFDKTYLRSNDGTYIDAKDGDLKYIAFDIRDLSANTTFSSGMVEDPEQDAYIVYVTGSDAQIIIDRSTSSVIGTVVSTDLRDNVDVNEKVVNTSYITNIEPSNGTFMYISEDPNAAQNLSTRIAETSDTLIIYKTDMNSKVFTPNKRYLLSNYENNPKYCGVYYMASKREIYLRSGDQLSCQMNITFKKCADFV